MVYDSYTLSPGYVYIHHDVSKTLLIPQFDSTDEFIETLTGSVCEVDAYMDRVGSDYKYDVRIPIRVFTNIDDIDDINDIVRAAVTGFFSRTVEGCMVYLYENES